MNETSLHIDYLFLFDIRKTFFFISIFVFIIEDDKQLFIHFETQIEFNL